MPKKKGFMPSPDDKNKGPIIKDPTKSKAMFGRAATQNMPASVAPKEGTSANPGVVLGLEASAMENPAMAEKLLQEFILPIDKEVVNKLDLDMVITRYLHLFNQTVVLGSSLVDHGLVAELEVEKQDADEELKRRLWKELLPHILARALTCAKSRSDSFIPALISKTSKSISTWLRRMKRKRRMCRTLAPPQ
ncbi:hypothetical protein Acr_00g0026310 [Actinidia rufa]|uniref:Uncharacterized protein n=1 Tax=Actinidia rufa TaxID=165716 RepID=A0A7J0DDL6_9ERIC|nr:hypothetical protein Acr_00g0026310 [Actinidia rufa]